jgi:hypothetical protein
MNTLRKVHSNQKSEKTITTTSMSQNYRESTRLEKFWKDFFKAFQFWSSFWAARPYAVTSGSKPARKQRSGWEAPKKGLGFRV